MSNQEVKYCPILSSNSEIYNSCVGERCVWYKKCYEKESDRKLWRMGMIGLMLFGLGVLVHDYAHALWQVGGYGEILSPQGGWVGLGIMGIAMLGKVLRR